MTLHAPCEFLRPGRNSLRRGVSSILSGSFFSASVSAFPLAEKKAGKDACDVPLRARTDSQPTQGAARRSENVRA